MDKPKQKRSPRRKSEDCHWTCRYCNKEFEIRQDLRNHLKECDLKPLPNPDRWKCDECDIVFSKRSELNKHIVDVHYNGVKLHRRDYGIKRSTSSHECPFCHRILVTCNRSFNYHINHCESNPDRKIFKGHPVSEETRKKISESMKIAVIEGRTHNIGECTWKGEKSYPEKWMTGVIENEFKDKNYEYNFRVGKYRLDFAWPKKMRYIEIDGDQHYRTEEAIEHDRVRTEYLEELGWTLLRRSWSYIIKNKDEFINEVKRFIDDVEDLPPEAQYRDKRKEDLLARERLKLECPDKFSESGRYIPTKYTESELREFLNVIKSSGVDLSKSGWKSKITRTTGLTRSQVNKAVNKFMNELDNVYIRSQAVK